MRVELGVKGEWATVWEIFYSRMGKDGRINVPLLALDLLQNRANEGKSLIGHVLEARIEPSERGSGVGENRGLSDE